MNKQARDDQWTDHGTGQATANIPTGHTQPSIRSEGLDQLVVVDKPRGVDGAITVDRQTLQGVKASLREAGGLEPGAAVEHAFVGASGLVVKAASHVRAGTELCHSYADLCLPTRCRAWRGPARTLMQELTSIQDKTTKAGISSLAELDNDS